MKKRYIFLTLAFVFVCVLKMQAQNLETDIVRVLSQDETVLSFSKDESGNISGILASGDVKFTSSNGYVRILAEDQYGYEKLVYESFPTLASEGGRDSFELMGFETGKIKDFIPEKIHVRISDAKLEHLKIIVSGIQTLQYAPSLQARTKSVSPSVVPIFDEDAMRRFFIARLNRKLAASGALWRAGDTPFSRLSYEEKKEMYGGVVPNFNGAEYYIGGIFDVDNYVAGSRQSQRSSYVPDFDWRMRHSATVKGSPYFQNEITGWITPVKDQRNCGSCWAFSAIGAMEAVAKLYRNTTYNFNLSEQELVSCSGAGSCNGGSASSALDYISRNRIQDELSFPYKAQDRPCSEKGKPLYTVKNAGKTIFSFSNNEFASTENLKSMLIKSPLAGRIGAWSHAMTLVGYKTIKAGDVVYSTTSSKITIQPGDPRIGKTAWIFKNSWGEDWGDHGFLYALVNINNMVYSATPTLPFEYKYYPYNNPSATSPALASALLASARGYDRDNDGYYWWGIGPRPGNLPANAKWEEDSDDSDASIGPMNQYGFPTLLKDYDLYIKDNVEDMGFEPNTTIKNDNFWSAPEIWIQYTKDGDINEHLNPIPKSKNYIKVRVWNRGTKTSKPSTVTAYWSKAGTNLPWPEAWTGEVLEDGVAMGARISDVGKIPPIEPGGSYVATIEWHTPDPEQYANVANKHVGGDNLWHFCLLLRIADKNDPDTYKFAPTASLNVINNNNAAQRNVTFVKTGNSFGYQGTVSMSNNSNTNKRYDLDVVEVLEKGQTSIFQQAEVSLKMSPQILNAWIKGGKEGVHLRTTAVPEIVEYTSSNGVLKNIIFNPKEYSLVKLKVNFTSTLPWYANPEKRTLLLRQIDEEGNVVGGETFVFIRNPRAIIYPYIEKEVEGDSLKLSVRNVDEEAEYRWFNSDGILVGENSLLSCLPSKNSIYKVEVTAKSDGYRTFSEINIDAENKESNLNIFFNASTSTLTLLSDLPKGTYTLHITRVGDARVYKNIPIDIVHQKKIEINVSDLSVGGYVASIVGEDGQQISSAKFFKP